jgi:hypothetical protein
VHEFVTTKLERVESWPMAGTPAWCALDDRDPAKWAALLDAAQHHALRIETAQETQAQTSRDVSAAADWPAIARETQRRNEFYAARPWMKRIAS